MVGTKSNPENISQSKEKEIEMVMVFGPIVVVNLTEEIRARGKTTDHSQSKGLTLARAESSPEAELLRGWLCSLCWWEAEAIGETRGSQICLDWPDLRSSSVSSWLCGPGPRQRQRRQRRTSPALESSTWAPSVWKRQELRECESGAFPFPERAYSFHPHSEEPVALKH